MSELTEAQIEQRARAAKWLLDAEEMIKFLQKRLELVPSSGLSVLNYSNDAAELATHALLLGSAEKSGSDEWYSVVKRFGAHRIEVYGQRDDVCERIVVGTRDVEKMVVDPDAPLVTVTVTEEIVEWVCPPSLHEMVEGA